VDVKARIGRVLSDYWASDPELLSQRGSPEHDDAAMTIKFAFEMNLPGLLPRAYYEALCVHDDDFDIKKLRSTAGLDAWGPGVALIASDTLQAARKELSTFWSAKCATPAGEYPRSCSHRQSLSNTDPAPDKFLNWQMAMHAKQTGLFKRYLNDPIRGMEAIRRNESIRPHGSENCSSCLGAIDMAWNLRKKTAWEEFINTLGSLVNGPPGGDIS